MALPTVQDIKDYLKVETTAEDTMLAALLARATALVEGLLGKPITAAATVVTAQAYPHPVTGRYRLMVPYPFATVTTITDADAATVDPTTFTADGQAGFLTFTEDASISEWYTVTVSRGWSAQTGYSTKAEPLISQAITDTVADWYQRRSPAANMETESGATASYATYLPLPPRVVATLDPLLRKGIR